MPQGAERSRTRVASAKTLFADAKIASKVRGAIPYLTFVTHVTLVPIDVLLHLGIFILLMDERSIRKL